VHATHASPASILICRANPYTARVPSRVRLDRLLANRGYAARRDVRDYLREADVREGDARLGKESQQVDPDRITIDGEPIDPPTLLLLLHKPLGYTCSHKDPGQIVYDLLPDRWQQRSPPVASVGRLDKETTGVLLLTDDGDLLHRLTSPKKHVPRVYHVTLQHAMRGDEAKVFASGELLLESDDKPLLPAELVVIDETHAKLTLHEGRYHQARRMFAAVGNYVNALHREAFGNLTLGDLPEGQWRHVKPEEIA
jgi:16S rRNA pseudouridine516 synthase